MYNQGLGSNGITIDGLDKRGYSSLDYTIIKGQVDNISGIFGFDDNTKIKPNSKLIILADGKIIFESKYINDITNSLEINTDIKKETKVITFRFETEIKSDVIPSILFVDIKVRKSS
ncbi:NPCBM/NEW2 domain-containing protein [Petrocella sp. FN5]|uniref:NPCBM/NEW2 domain-containing protein n=1 Tax=Petrocella sp. FN5 TaxID=3032002 RepID=UPI0023DAB46F|nr:NPCBM/NEW2 domain-containing protein [Petrocella sp. FN5]MDF1616744.1 NPCBM/NEW2 domain-containing protein [Petrocella sp. FN5]